MKSRAMPAVRKPFPPPIPIKPNSRKGMAKRI